MASDFARRTLRRETREMKPRMGLLESKFEFPAGGPVVCSRVPALGLHMHMLSAPLVERAPDPANSGSSRPVGDAPSAITQRDVTQ